MVAFKDEPGVYRLIVTVDGRGRLHEDRVFGSFAAAQSCVADAVRQRSNDGEVSTVALQTGIPVEHPQFDPYRVTAGICGGWSRIAWRTVKVWDREVALRILNQAPTPPPKRLYKSHRPTLLAALATVVFALLSITLIQSGGISSKAFAAPEGTRGALEQIPVAARTVDADPASADANSIGRSLSSALGTDVARSQPRSGH